MDVKEILLAVGITTVISVIIGIVLGLAEKVFHIEVDEKEEQVREALPGSNCGGCGFAGCDSLAKAIANGTAPVSGCPVGGKPVAEKIAEIMGQELGKMERKIAYVKCDGTCEKRQESYNYFGIDSCVYAAKMPGSSPYSCSYGCLGFGSCAKVCPVRAIRIVDKKAIVDESLCIACGKCVKICPHKLIDFVPAKSSYRVQCSSILKGKDVTTACTAGCIGCGLCAKACPNDAIVFENNIARIDYEKCIACGECEKKCPRNIIKTY